MATTRKAAGTVARKVSKKVAKKASEKVAAKVADKAANKAAHQVANKVGHKVANKMAQKVAKKTAAARPAAAVDFSPDVVREAVRGRRFLAADRAALDLTEIATWDRYLLRESRLLVPIDVQALYVPPGDTEPMVRLPMLVANVGASRHRTPRPAARPFDAGLPRPGAGPPALGDARRFAARDLDRWCRRRHQPARLPALPGPIVVLRIVLPKGRGDPSSPAG
jgi:hypothetical protein